jgi:hypothetical protein
MKKSAGEVSPQGSKDTLLMKTRVTIRTSSMIEKEEDRAI